MKYIWLILFLIPFVYASPEIATLNEPYTIFATIIEEGDYPTQTINANLSIYFSNGTAYIENQTMNTITNGKYSYTLTPSLRGQFLIEVRFLKENNTIKGLETGTLIVNEEQTMSTIAIIFGLISLVAFILYSSWAVKQDKETVFHRAFSRVWFIFTVIPLNFLTFAMMEFSSGQSYHGAFVTLFNIGFVGSILFAIVMFVLLFTKSNIELVENSYQPLKGKFKNNE